MAGSPARPIARSVPIFAQGRIHGPVAQRDWLRRLGIDQRAAALRAHAPYGKSTEIDQALSRLTGTTLFDPTVYFLSRMPAELSIA